jgi:2'-hydroxyisoflavone reductase
MKLLVIGGSLFVGRHLVEAALARGDQVTVFNRGRTAASWPPGVQLCIGDRKSDLSALATGTWDAVVDTCGYLPRDVARMAECLHGRVGRYVFFSSISVYADFTRPNDEHSVLGRIDDADTEVVDGRTYGPLKALCEAAVTARFGEAHSLLIRPGLIVGPHDPTQRFTYWPARVARAVDGQPLLAPGTAADLVQFIDVRDVVDFVLRTIGAGRSGPFNVTSSPRALTMGAVLEACATAAGTQPRWRWLSAEQIDRCGLQPWTELPIWLPSIGEHAAFALADTRAAQAAGLATRPLAQTVADTLAWYRSLPAAQQAFSKAGLSPEREAQALEYQGLMHR